MRQAVVQADHGVEIAIGQGAEFAHVGGEELGFERTVAGFLARPFHGIGAEIAGGDAMSALRQAERLGADAAGAVQDSQGR